MNNPAAGQVSYRHDVEQLVAQAAIHLHNALGPVGVALFDQYGSLIFNNNATHHLDEQAIACLIGNSLTKGCAECRTERGITACALALDPQHVMVVVGRQLELHSLDGCVATLRQMMPKPPALSH